MTTSRLSETALATGLPVRLPASRPETSPLAVSFAGLQPAVSSAGPDSIPVNLPGSAASPAKAVEFVDRKLPSVQVPAAPQGPLQLIRSLMQQTLRLSQSISQHQAAVVLLEQIHLALDQGMSLEEAFYQSFDPADFKHLLNQAGMTPQQVLQLLADSAREQVKPSAGEASAQETSARQLAGEVLQLTHELEARSADMIQLTGSSREKRQQASDTSQELQQLKHQQTVQNQKIQAITGLIQQVATGAWSTCQAGVAAPVAAAGAQACAPLPSAELLEQWDIDVKVPASGHAVFAIAGHEVSEVQLVGYLSQEEQKQQELRARNQQALELKVQELRHRQFELALIEQVLSSSRKGVAVLAQKLEQKRDALMQNPAAAALPGYAQLMVRSAQVLAAARQALIWTEQELEALHRVCHQLEQQWQVQASHRHTPLPVTDPLIQLKVAEPVPYPSQPGTRPQSWDRDFLAQVEAENQAIQREQTQSLQVRQLNQHLTDQQLQAILAVQQYHQQQRERRWAA